MGGDGKESVTAFFVKFLKFLVIRYNTARPAAMSDVYFRHKMFSILDVPAP